MEHQFGNDSHNSVLLLCFQLEACQAPDAPKTKDASIRANDIIRKISGKDILTLEGMAAVARCILQRDEKLQAWLESDDWEQKYLNDAGSDMLLRALLQSLVNVRPNGWQET